MNNSRRKLIAFISFNGILAGLSGLSFSSYKQARATSEATETIINKVFINFPQGKSLATGVVELNSWVNSKAYLELLKNFKKANRVQAYSISLNTMPFEVDLSFRSPHDRQMFIDALNANKIISHQLGKSLGYEITEKISRA